MAVTNKRVRLSINKDIKERLQRYCFMKGVQQSKVFRQVITEYVQQNKDIIEYYIAHTNFLTDNKVKYFHNMEIKTVCFLINPDTYTMFRVACVAENISISGKLDQLLGDFLERNS